MRKSQIPLLFVVLLLFASCKTANQKGLSKSSDREKVVSTSLLIDAVKEKNIGNLEAAITNLNLLINSNPQNDVAFYQRSLVWQQQNKLDQALEDGQKAVEIKPENEWYLLNLAELHETLKHYPQASKIRENLIVKSPQNLDYRYDLVIDYIYSDRWEDAINQYNEIEKQTGVTEDISLAKHRIWLYLKKPLNAANEIKLLIAAFPAENRYPLLLGDLYLKNRMLSLAKEQYDKSLAMNNMSTYMSLAEYYRTRENSDSTEYCLLKAFSEPSVSIDLKVPVMLSYYNLAQKNPTQKKSAYPLLDAIVKAHPEDPKGWSVLGDFLLSDKRYGEAKSAFMKVLDYDQSKYVIWEELLKILVNESSFDSAIVYSNRAIEYFPSQPFLFYVKGISHFMKKDYSEAISALETGKNLVLDPNGMYLEMFIYLGESYHKMGNNSRSDAAFDKVLDFDPKNDYVLNNYSYYLALRGEQLEKAKRMANDLVAANPDKYNYLDTYAWVLFKKGEFAEALVWIEKAMPLGGNKSASILEHYGDILWKNGQIAAALEIWQKALLLEDANIKLKQKVTEKKYVE